MSSVFDGVLETVFADSLLPMLSVVKYLSSYFMFRNTSMNNILMISFQFLTKFDCICVCVCVYSDAHTFLRKISDLI